MKVQHPARGALALLGFGAATAGAALAGAAVSPDDGKAERWYRRLRKPAFTPPRAAFPIVWTTLYALMAASAYRVWRQEESPARKRALASWWAQLAANAAWSPLFFGARRPRAALADLGLLLALLAVYTRESNKVNRGAALMMAPYLAWTGFAGVLNEEIARLNR
jgi:tryptophan-rich sensory protein